MLRSFIHVSSIAHLYQLICILLPAPRCHVFCFLQWRRQFDLDGGYIRAFEFWIINWLDTNTVCGHEIMNIPPTSIIVPGHMPLISTCFYRCVFMLYVNMFQFIKLRHKVRVTTTACANHCGPVLHVLLTYRVGDAPIQLTKLEFFREITKQFLTE